MADSNNERAASLPDHPNDALKSLRRLVGTWKIGGSLFHGTVRFEWMEGGFFLVQHVDGEAGGRRIRGTEYIGFDEDSKTLRSHYMDVHGANFTYTWEVEGDTLRTWFGERGSNNHFEGRFSEDGDSYSGAWQWPGGGYSATATRVKGKPRKKSR